MPKIATLDFAPVDARDVATAHRLALQVPAAAGRRYILSTEAIWLADIARRLVVSERTVEGYVRHLLIKIGLAEVDHGHRRVLAVLAVLAHLRHAALPAPPMPGVWLETAVRVAATRLSTRGSNQPPTS
ncbi:hypothetical protein [Frankia sp. ACN1ag]|uniref:hypothetical protein n=1 Tax=Frankia sp. ACN1ag TaxID=102891 RepID=UPI0006DCC380|nr:hypothetical protein [Frankia sp. ACN1ag]KQC37853.1 hypothetical protein UK82_12640 [Frankia sp. ACN1ag]